MAAASSPLLGWPPGRRRRSSLAVAGVAVVAALLVWAFIAAGGLKSAAHTESSCEQLWQDGRHTSSLAGADHEAFIAACVDH